MKLISQLVLFSTAGLLATATFADSSADTKPIAKDSIYVSGAAGYGSISTPDKADATPDGTSVTGATYSKGSLASSFNVGYNHALSNHILVGGELGWDYNGKSQYTTSFPGDVTEKLTIRSFDYHLLATSTYLFSNGLNFFGKAGVATVNQRGIISFSGFADDSTSKTELHPLLAFGVGYQIKMVNLFVQYDHLFGENANDLTDVYNDKGQFSNTVAANSIKAGVGISLAI